MAYKRWIIADADKEKASELSEKFNIDPFIAFLLVARGIDSDLAVSDFLSRSYEFSDPYNLADMEKAVQRIERAIDYSEKITIYGDYDCDGVTATALLLSLLKNMGADVDYYIPSRETEGYGLNNSAIDKIHENGTQLIITVDNGISANKESEYIYSLGMELIITDHHQIGSDLPRAEAVINPHRAENDIKFRELAGVGVAFKLACALYGDTEDMLYRYSDLAAVGTIGDIVPLVNENRGLVKAGLRLINSGENCGIEALKKVAGVNEKEFTSTDIAFIICPRINATGRIDNASRAVDLLTCDDYNHADFKAEQINIDNSHRQELEQNIFDDVKLHISQNPALVRDRVIVINGIGYHQGVVGIVASRILDEYGKPSIIIGVSENGTARGSARSIEGFNIYEAISYCSDILEQYGGHPRAAGLTISADKIAEFRQRINKYAAEYYPIMPAQVLHIDCKLSPYYLNLDLADNLSVLEPYGENNPRAVFALIGLTLVSVTSIGSGKHIRIECEKKGKKIKIVKFGMTADEFPFLSGEKIDAAVRVSKNFYNGRDYLSVQAVDIRKNGINDEYFFAEKAVYELFMLNKNNDVSVYPDRDICAVIYKILKSRGGWQGDFDSLYFTVGSVSYGQLKFALKAFEESGLISIENGVIALNDIKSKVDLMNTKSMKSLKGRLNIE